MRVLGAPSEVIYPSGRPIDFVPGNGTWLYDDAATSAGTPVEYFADGSWPAKAPDASCYGQAVLHRALSYSRPDLKDPMCWKACLRKGYPIIFGFDWYKEFDPWSSRVKETPCFMPKPVTRDTGGHCVLAVGWDDSKGDEGCFRVQNSWGPDWGEDGLFWMPYAVFKIDGFLDSPWTFMNSGN